MPDTQTLADWQDEQRYSRLRVFAGRKRRWADDNGRKPNMPTLPPPPTDAEWRVWLALDAAKAARADRIPG